MRFALITIGLIATISWCKFHSKHLDAFQFTGATAAVCLGFIFPASLTLRDRHNIATRRDKILCVFMIVLAVFSNAVAIYSDAYALIKRNPSHRE
uniref:Amino acid transporter transmembrane domain-containing protein n=1 Tax=Salix viminalis TaxID=40686 RepID=A0A6N2LHI7_SALVM